MSDTPETPSPPELDETDADTGIIQFHRVNSDGNEQEVQRGLTVTIVLYPEPHVRVE